KGLNSQAMEQKKERKILRLSCPHRHLLERLTREQSKSTFLGKSKEIFMKFKFIAILTLVSAPALGQIDIKEPILWPKLHKHNRAVAFGSVLIAGNGSNVMDWTKVEAHNYCDDFPIPGPLPIPPEDSGDP